MKLIGTLIGIVIKVIVTVLTVVVELGKAALQVAFALLSQTPRLINEAKVAAKDAEVPNHINDNVTKLTNWLNQKKGQVDGTRQDILKNLKDVQGL